MITCLLCNHEQEENTSKIEGDCYFSICEKCGKEWMSVYRFRADAMILNDEHIVNIEVKNEPLE